MQLKDIEYVAMIASEKSFSSAAQKLFISQPALSQAIKKLEKELGVLLFDRTTSSVELSAAGKIFLSEGEDLLRLSIRLKNHMLNLSAQRIGNLRIGISTFYSSYYLTKILPDFQALHPGIHIEICEGTSHHLEEMVLQESVDFSLIPMPFDHPEELDCLILHQEQILFAIPAESPLRNSLHVAMSADHPYIDLSDASGESFIFLHTNQRFYQTALSLCRSAGFEPQISYRLSNWDAINALIGSGMGVGFVPEIVVNRILKDIPSPIYCRIINNTATRSYVMAYKKQRNFTSAASDFYEFMFNLFRK